MPLNVAESLLGRPKPKVTRSHGVPFLAVSRGGVRTSVGLTRMSKGRAEEAMAAVERQTDVKGKVPRRRISTPRIHSFFCDHQTLVYHLSCGSILQNLSECCETLWFGHQNK